MDPSEAQRLRDEIERTLHQTFDPVDVLPRLLRLSRGAPAASAHGLFAHGRLAELLVERSPWRAALYARRVLAHRDDDDRAWAVLAFAHTLLGHYRSAAGAYRRALAASPDNCSYAHNLGHLLDVALGRSAEAIPYLRRAHRARPESTEFVASFVHALARAGKLAEARTVLDEGRAHTASRELDALSSWLDQGAPARAPRVDAEPHTAAAPPSTPPGKRARRTPSPSRRLAKALAQGISHLPFAEGQRVRAFELAEEVAAALVPSETGAKRPADADLAGLAAAVAYAVVYVDHLPLTQAEVAAPFRVGVGRLRGRFAELRARLDLIRVDVRYRTTRA